MQPFGAFSLTIVMLFASAALAETQTPLHTLNAGTRLVAKHAIVIPANTGQLTFSSGAFPGPTCQLRMKESKPYDRVLMENHEISVASTSRAGFTAPRRLSTTTYVQLRSHSIEDIVCVTHRGMDEMTVAEFAKVVSSGFSIEPSAQPPIVID